MKKKEVKLSQDARFKRQQRLPYSLIYSMLAFTIDYTGIEMIYNSFGTDIMWPLTATCFQSNRKSYN